MEKKLQNTNEIISLLRRIREGATSNTTSLSEILRLCMRLGKQLGNEELVSWARMEASGYTKAEDLPDYRKLPSESQGDFYGSYGRGIKNAHIPDSVIEQGHRDSLCNVYMFEPVTELENLAISSGGKDNILKIPWSGDVIAYYQKKEIYSGGMVLATAWRVMTKQKLTGVLETIRTRVLDFILEIEEELGLQGESEDQNPEIVHPQPQKIEQIFINTIHGGNVAVGNNRDISQQVINIKQGNIDSLKSYLKELGLEEKDTHELEQAIKEDGVQTKEPGPAVSRWLVKVAILGVKGGLSVASNVAGSLVANAIMKFYGIS